MEQRKEPKRVVIMGAAGRDFHDFNTCFRDDPERRVVAFTAAQIPDIAGRRYPPSLAGPLYPDGIPILPEEEIRELIRREGVDQVYLCYSDLSHETVMHKASIVLAAGAGFGMLGPDQTMLPASRPVLSVCAVRTGVGKSALSRHLVRWLRDRGHRVSAVRHPMPYGDLEAQRTQRFASRADLDAAKATIEEREEYEPYIEMGASIHAGVDYAAILEQAEQEGSVVLWDGGNNDLPFFRPDLHIVMLDAHRAGDELAYHPGEANFRMADVVVINKVDSARSEDVERLVERASRLRPDAPIVLGALELTIDDETSLRGARVVIVGDGPTLTHGGLPSGAGALAARRWGVNQVVEARPYARGALAETFAAFPHLGPEVPAMGYGEAQIRDLESTLRAVPADLVIDASPASIGLHLELDKPIVKVGYAFAERGDVLEPLLVGFEERFLASR